ncbi:MAG: L-threonylcarbamoyladenylate synthase [Vicinamibacterales bacterium]
MTRVLTVDPERPDPQIVEEAARSLQRGDLVAFPTETVYGLGAHALDSTAVERLFRAKGRPVTDPVIVHLADGDRVGDVARRVPAVAQDLARRFWPGPLTLILWKRERVPDTVTAGQPTVGVRVPSHPVALLLLRMAGVPVAAPSANQFARPSPTRAAHVLADLEGVIDVLLDAGPTTIGIESTILDLTVSPPLVRRPGRVSLEQIREFVPDAQSVTEVHGLRSAQPSAGQLARHYAPRATLTLYVGEPDRVAARLANDARSAAASGSRVGVLAPEEDLIALAPRLAAVAATGRIVTMRYGSRRKRADAARDLFRALRDLDGEGVDIILASAPDPQDIGVAVIDRLTRAAEGRVIYA